MKTKLITQRLNNITALYAIRDNVMTFTVVPSSRIKDVKEEALFKNDWSQYFYVDPMIQIALKGDEVVRDFSAGNTLYNAESAFDLKYYKQETIEQDDALEIRTTFKGTKIEVVHVIRQVNGYEAVEMYNIVKNISTEAINLDRFSSFFIGCLSPFMKKNNGDKLLIHELQSYWAMEARKSTTPISKYNFEDSWSGLGIKTHRIGVNGTMPASIYHPFIAVEDIENKVTWAIQIEAPSSWEIEATFKYGRLTLSGGQADFINGHWRKSLQPNETFTTRKAYVTVVNGDLTYACSKITRYHDNLLTFPKSEENLPVIFNEYLTTWGNPSMENIPKQIPYLKYLECEYYVADAGWFCEDCMDIEGDWDVSSAKFPRGLGEFTSYMYKNGLSRCGVWFEFEGVTDNSNCYKNHKELLATRDGKLIHRETRLFLDFRKEEVTKYLEEKVIKTIKENNISYIKIDYNENVGLGMDDKDSLGEGLRVHAEKVLEFMRRLRKEFPELVMENCSSGGMRHEVCYNTVSSMVSFSDAHENFDGVVVAMDLHRIMQPRIMQIWASLLKKHTLDDVYCIVAKAMLGRVCFAGKLDEISKDALAVALEGKHYYDTIKHIIRDGTTILIDTDQITSLSAPHGAIRLIRESLNQRELLCYAFNFGEDINEASFNINSNIFELVNTFGNAKVDEKGHITFKGAHSAIVAHYIRKDD